MWAIHSPQGKNQHGCTCKLSCDTYMYFGYIFSETGDCIPKSWPGQRTSEEPSVYCWGQIYNRYKWSDMCVVVDSPNWRANASFFKKLRHTCSTPQIHVLITISQLLIKTVFCIPYTQPTEVDCSTVLSHEGVYFSCPLCPVSALQSQIDAHLSDCLHKVLVENSYRYPSVWVECPFVQFSGKSVHIICVWVMSK